MSRLFVKRKTEYVFQSISADLKLIPDTCPGTCGRPHSSLFKPPVQCLSSHGDIVEVTPGIPHRVPDSIQAIRFTDCLDEQLGPVLLESVPLDEVAAICSVEQHELVDLLPFWESP